MKDQQHEMTIT